MALIKCNECGQSMSDKADVCPNCGAPVGAAETQNVRPMRPPVQQEAVSDKIKKRVQFFLMNNKKYLPENRIPQLRERMLTLNEDELQNVECISFKDPTTLLIISIFLGEVGVDRFMLGDVGLGVGKLLLTLCCGIGLIWWLIDIFFIMDRTKEFNYRKVEETFALLEFQ